MWRRNGRAMVKDALGTVTLSISSNVAIGSPEHQAACVVPNRYSLLGGEERFQIYYLEP